MLRQAYSTGMDASTAPGDVFQLYQQGPTPDHVLQLCYLRRRAPHHLHLERTCIEDEFLLPRPELKIASLLPTIDIPLQQLLTAPSVEKANSSVVAELITDTAVAYAKESAQLHFLQPRQAAAEDIRQWFALAESDWLHIYHSLQRPEKQLRQDDDITEIDAAALVPNIADICWLLEQCPSDALASFVWDHLLISLLQQCNGPNSSHKSTHQCLLSLLASQHSFASLSAKDFRAKVRSRNLRQVDDVFGAQAELAMIALCRKQRDGAK